jgi:hypothetical protein
MKRKRTQKQKRKQKQKKINQPVKPVEEVKPVKEVKKFKKLAFSEYYAYGIDENHDVYKFDANKMELFKSKVKNIFDFEDDVFLIDLDGKLFKTNDSFSNCLECSNLKTNLKFKKVFASGNRIFANTMDGNTYYLHLNEEKVIFEKKLPCHLKKITHKRSLYHDPDDPTQLVYSSIFIAIDYDNQFYMSGYYTKEYSGKMHCLGKEPKEEMIKLLGDNFPKENIDNVISELLHGENEFVIDCSGKKIDVKMIHGICHLQVAADRDGRVYFKGYDKGIFSKVKYKYSTNWTETPYFIEVKPKLKTK